MENIEAKLNQAFTAAQTAFIARVAKLDPTKTWDQTDCEHFTLRGIGIAFTSLDPEHAEYIAAEVAKWEQGLYAVTNAWMTKKRVAKEQAEYAAKASYTGGPE
jgi:hypothetical protein